MYKRQLLVLSGLQQHLVRTKKRTSVGIVLETGEPREVHHFATLIGYGACAINPYLAHESIKQLIDTDMLQKDYYAAVDDYNNACLLYTSRLWHPAYSPHTADMA